MDWNTIFTGALGGIIAGIVLFSLNWLKDHRIQKNSHNFDLAFSSEAAKIIVNKQLDFGVKYLNLVANLLDDLRFNIEKDSFINYAANLRDIREESVLWIDDDTENFLLGFEKDIRELGRMVRKLNMNSGLKFDEETKKQWLNKRNLIIGNVLGKDYGKCDLEKADYKKVIRKIRDMIGVSQVLNNKQKYK